MVLWALTREQAIAPSGTQHAIGNAIRQVVGPMINGGLRAADNPRGGGLVYLALGQELYCFQLFHRDEYSALYGNVKIAIPKVE